MKKSGLKLITLSIAIYMAMSFSGCGNNSKPLPQTEGTTANSIAINVKAEPVTTSTLVESIRLLGTTEAEKDVTFSAEAAGRLEYLAVDLGDKVRRGQLIARIDYEMLKAQADQARAGFDLAEKTYTRLETLREEELVTQQQIDEASAQKTQAYAMLQQAEAALKRSEVKSTVTGIVAGKYVEEGEYLMPGSPIIRVLDYSDIFVTAQVPESRVPEINDSARVSVSIDVLDEQFPAELDVLVPQSDPESRTFTIRVKTPNTSGRILAGMAATLNIETRIHEDIIAIPQETIIEQSEGRYVFVTEGTVARKRLVTLGAAEKHNVIITDGLQVGDRLVMEGQRSLVDGQPINIVD